MNRITHSIFLIFTVFILLCSTKVEAQYQNSNSSKMPLGFMSSQYWQFNYLTKQDSSINIDNDMGARIFAKSGLGLLLGSVGFLGGLIFGCKTSDYCALGAIFAPVGFILGSSLGVKLVSNAHDNDAPFGILLLAGLGGIGVGAGTGYLIGKAIDDKSVGGVSFISAVVFGLVAEIWVSELEYSSKDDSDWDEYIYNDSDKYVFHEYVKNTQVFNFELFRIQL